MKKIILVRHAESEANAEKKLFPHANNIKITQNGVQQATSLIELVEKPDRIIVSKYIRTLETAEPLIKSLIKNGHKHEVHVWLETHEFDSVCSVKIRKMSSHEEFLEANSSYWAKADPFFRDSEHLETFKEFIDRVNSAIIKLKNISDGVNFVFTHGWFIKLFLLLTKEFSDFEDRKNEEGIYKKIMDRFLEWDKEFKTQNTGTYDVTELVNNFQNKTL